jgi:Pilus formation protein N terminal region
MRKIALSLALALAPAAALAASLGVPLDQSTYVTLTGPAHNVILGNPAIADVLVSDPRHLVVTGKGKGVTNLIVTDAAGRTIFDRQIVVGAGSGDRVLLINGASLVRYACTPGCEQMGDSQGAPAGGEAPAAAPAATYGSPAPAPAAIRSPQP